MHLIEQTYKSLTGYHDVSPGRSVFEFAVHKLDDDKGTVVSKPTGEYNTQFNEVQISGDSDLRKSYLPSVDDGSSILFIDDVDYDAKFLRRHLMSTKDIPLTETDNFIRRWGAMAYQSGDVIKLDTVGGTKHHDGGGWGTINDMSKKKDMLAHIANMDDTTRDALTALNDSQQFSIAYIVWRDTLADGVTIQYQSVGV